MLMSGVAFVALAVLGWMRVWELRPRDLQIMLSKVWRSVFAFSFLATLVVTIATMSFTSYLNLGIVEQTTLPLECRDDIEPRTGDHKIKWIGSKAIVLKCERTWFVILNYDSHTLLWIR
jgi:hypothetical protein